MEVSAVDLEWFVFGMLVEPVLYPEESFRLKKASGKNTSGMKSGPCRKE
jgi:hypothetical protein